MNKIDWEAIIIGALILVVIGLLVWLGWGIYLSDVSKERCTDRCFPVASRVIKDVCECASEEGHWVPQKRE